MTSMELTVRSSPGPNPGPHSVKQWQLSGTDYQPQSALRHRSSVTGTADTRFSAWTPITNKTSNHQLFEERTTLVLHWFDLWTDRQRKLFLQALLSQCSNSQLKSCRDWLMQIVPVTRVDFTSVLPRFLSLYVMSFLTPRDLCSAAQVSWHWRVLAEQDCLWSVRCVRRGWFLPYNPGDREYGGWKSHYVSCVSTLDWLTPREAAQTYGTLNMPCSGEREEEEERRRERRIRQTIRERVEEQKRASLKSRPAWKSNSNRPGRIEVSRTQGERRVPGRTRSILPSPSRLSDRTGRLCLSPDVSLNLTPTLTLEKTQLSSHVRSQAMGDSVNSGGWSTSTSSRPRASPSLSPSPPLLLLLSNRIPAYELVLCGVRVGVVVVLYDHRGTLQALLSQAERALGGQRAQRLGVLAPGGTEEITLLQGCKVTERSVLTPDYREFWEKLCGWVVPPEEGGGVDIFCPLAASARGVLLVQSLSTLTELEVSAPTGMATGCFQNILSEWSCSSGDSAGVRGVCASPAQRYVCEGVLQGWSWQTQWLEEALGALRDHLGPQLPRLSLDTRGRVLGQFLWEAVALDHLSVSKEVTVALTEGLTALATEETRPLEFLSLFLRRWGEKRKDINGGEKTEGGERSSVFLTERGPHRLLSPIPEIQQEWRGVVVRELYISERVYVRRLESMKRIYHDPLLSALQSNRAILSSAHINMVLTPLTHILDVNRLFLSELGSRLQQWEADQCVGDVCVKFCSKLRVYTNYLNNYPTALLTIDKCREMNPAFRAFLKRQDRTLETHMLSLQELLLCPVWRMEEYLTLLQALSLHTVSQHSDHTQLSGVLDTLTHYRDFIRKLKRNSEKAVRMQETQGMIRGCPNLCEGGRQLITTQDAALLKCPSDDITASLRMYEHVSDVGLFLFNDAMVLTERNVCHRPFTHTHCDTHTFLASVALHSLTLREITDTRSGSMIGMNISTRDSCDVSHLSKSHVPVPGITWPYIAAELLIALLAIAGNILVCLAVNRNRKLRTVTNYFLVSLAVADIFVGVLAIPCAVLTDLGLPRHNLPLCLLLLSVLIVLTQSSILSLLAVAAERYVAILLPLQYQRIVSPRNARLALVLTWCLALLSGCIPLMGWHGSLPPSGACLFPCVVNLSYMVYFNFLGCVLVPLVVMFIIYGHIFLTVRQQLRRIAAGRGPARPDTRDGETGPARPDTREGERGPARPDTRDAETGPARSDTRDGERGPARPDTREGERGPARPDTRDGERGQARPDTREGERGPARPDTRDGETGPARPDTRDGETGPARPDTRDGEGRPARPDTRDGERGPARPDTRVGKTGPARPYTRVGETGPARPDTRDGEGGPARPDTRDGERGPTRPDTRVGETRPARPDTRDGEGGPARPDTRVGKTGPARPDTREGERGPARPDTRDCGSGAGSREDEVGAGKRARVEAGAGKRARVEPGAGKRTRVEAGAGKRTRVEAVAGKRARIEAWGVSGVAVWGEAGHKGSEGESWSGNAGVMTSHASGYVRTDSGSVVASESKSESRGPVKARCGSGGSECKRAVRMRREVRKATSLFLVLFLFMLCWLPLHFLNCVKLMCPRCHVPLPLTLAAILLSHANSALNPLLYAYRMRSFRHTLRALCCTHTA